MKCLPECQGQTALQKKDRGPCALYGYIKALSAATEAMAILSTVGKPTKSKSGPGGAKGLGSGPG